MVPKSPTRSKALMLTLLADSEQNHDEDDPPQNPELPVVQGDRLVVEVGQFIPFLDLEFLQVQYHASNPATRVVSSVSASDTTSVLMPSAFRSFCAAASGTRTARAS